MRAGVKIDAETLGEGDLAKKGDRVKIRLQVCLNRGELVQDVSGAVSHNILEFCARVPARRPSLGPGSHRESRAVPANRCLHG